MIGVDVNISSWFQAEGSLVSKGGRYVAIYSTARYSWTEVIYMEQLLFIGLLALWSS